jgi:site-specific DNA-methyltransferase (adenine-specific)
MTRWTLTVDDMREALARMEPDSIDACLTDPPYELGFMGKAWDSTGVAFDPDTWRAVYRVLKPGAHLLAFGGTRTVHRIACAIEDAGFQIRDQLAWMYGSGFPKSLDVSKALDKAAGAEGGKGPLKRGGERLLNQAPGGKRDGEGLWGDESGRSAHTYVPATDDAKRYQGCGTALKPAQEPIILARKPLVGTVAENVLAYGTGGLNIDGCRIETEDSLSGGAYTGKERKRDDYHPTDTAPGAMPLSRLQSGFAKYKQPLGRWPSNVLLDEEAAALLDEQSGDVASNGGGRRSGALGGQGLGYGGATPDGGRSTQFRDKGGASRFFYVAKPSRKERDEGLDLLPASTGGEATGRKEGSAGLRGPALVGANGGARNIHPTVKPIDLGRYLSVLITPPGGTVLDPFTGSAGLLCGALVAGFRCVGIEMDTPHAVIAHERLRHWETRTIAKGGKARSVDASTGQADLFAGATP